MYTSAKSAVNLNAELTAVPVKRFTGRSSFGRHLIIVGRGYMYATIAIGAAGTSHKLRVYQSITLNIIAACTCTCITITLLRSHVSLILEFSLVFSQSALFGPVSYRRRAARSVAVLVGLCLLISHILWPLLQAANHLLLYM